MSEVTNEPGGAAASNPTGDRVEVVVETLTGDRVSLSAATDQTVRDLVAQIKGTGRFPAGRLKLVHGARLLEGALTLAEAGLAGEVELTVVVAQQRFAGLAAGRGLGRLGRTGQLFSERSFTVEAWVKIHSLNADFQGDNAIIGTQSFPQGGGLHLILRNGTPLLGFYYNDTGASHQVSVGTWTHLAFVYDLGAREQRIFVNGEPAGTGHDKPPLSGDLDVFIGTWAFGGRYLNGEMLLLSVWSMARTAEQVRESFRSAEPSLDSEGLVVSCSFCKEGDRGAFRVDAVTGKTEPLELDSVVEVEDSPF